MKRYIYFGLSAILFSSCATQNRQLTSYDEVYYSQTDEVQVVQETRVISSNRAENGTSDMSKNDHNVEYNRQDIADNVSSSNFRGSYESDIRRFRDDRFDYAYERGYLDGYRDNSFAMGYNMGMRNGFMGSPMMGFGYNPYGFNRFNRFNRGVSFGWNSWGGSYFSVGFGRPMMGGWGSPMMGGWCSPMMGGWGSPMMGGFGYNPWGFGYGGNNFYQRNIFVNNNNTNVLPIQPNPAANQSRTRLDGNRGDNNRGRSTVSSSREDARSGRVSPRADRSSGNDRVNVDRSRARGGTSTHNRASRSERVSPRSGGSSSSSGRASSSQRSRNTENRYSTPRSSSPSSGSRGGGSVSPRSSSPSSGSRGGGSVSPRSSSPSSGSRSGGSFSPRSSSPSSGSRSGGSVSPRSSSPSTGGSRGSSSSPRSRR